MNRKPLKVSYNARTDVLRIDGFAYAGELFRALGGPTPMGNWFQVVSRDDGRITLRSLGPDVESELERLRRELRSAECVISQVAEDTFGKEMTVKEFADASSYDS
jgi:hypothetical protein